MLAVMVEGACRGFFDKKDVQPDRLQVAVFDIDETALSIRAEWLTSLPQASPLLISVNCCPARVSSHNMPLPAVQQDLTTKSQAASSLSSEHSTELQASYVGCTMTQALYLIRITVVKSEPPMDHKAGACRAERPPPSPADGPSTE